MNVRTEDLQQGQDRGLVPVILSLVATRLELAAIDVEAHLKATVASVMAMFAAVVLALVAFTFIGIAVIVAFWDTHRVVAAWSVLGAYAALAITVALLARRAWRTRPPALEATLRELELDRAAFRGRT